MPKTYCNAAAQKIISSGKCDWIHVSLSIPVPPTYDGSYNFLIWDVLKRRRQQDLLISKFFPDSFLLADRGDVPVVQVRIPTKRDWGERVAFLLHRFAAAARHQEPVLPVYRKIGEVIRQVGCDKVLIWGRIQDLPTFRRLLPAHMLAYAQRHFDYPLEISHYEYADIVLTQTRGQTRHAFSRLTQLSPLVLTIPNGVELDVFTPPTSLDHQREIRRRLGIPTEAFVLVFPSKLARKKGVPYLLRWIESLTSASADVFFLVVGSVDYYYPPGRRAELANILSSNANVKWVNGAPRRDMPDYYRSADVCLMPGLWREGFSMTAIEGLASGLPLVASRAGCYLEIVKDGYNGFLCRQEYLYEDGMAAIQRLRSEPDLLRQMSANARHYAQNRLSRERVLANFDAFLEGHYDEIDDDITVRLE